MAMKWVVATIESAWPMTSLQIEQRLCPRQMSAMSKYFAYRLPNCRMTPGLFR